MSSAQVNTLTLEQEALIPIYQAKWRQITLATEPIDPRVATSQLTALYSKLGLSRPTIRFFDSPYAALSSSIFDQTGRSIGHLLENRLENLLRSLLAEKSPWPDRGHQFWRLTSSQFANNLGFLLHSQLEDQFADYPPAWLRSHAGNCLQPQLWQDCHGSWFDFAISVLHYAHNGRTWDLLQTLGQHCGWIFPYDDFCVICARPTRLLLDSDDQFHAEGEPAIQFADGFGVYVDHGMRLSERSGTVPPAQWRSRQVFEKADFPKELLI